MWTIFSKELNTFFNSLIAYLVISVFLTAVGLLVWVFPDTSVLNYGYADLETLFAFSPYVFMFLIPAITMRMFAEEKKSGTMELLFTNPVSDNALILGKYLSSLVIVFLAIIPTVVYYYSLVKLGQPEGNIDSAAVFGSYVGLLLLGGVFAAIGILSSAITVNQITSFIIAVFLCFIMYSGLSSLANVNVWGDASLLLSQLSLSYHYEALGKGLIDSRNVIYLVSVIVIMLAITKTVLSSRKW
ncbi:gliding motility-associated ABC transporter permease subunit GldF [Marinigracilibium pacificum]|uniref:Gliding motility-associated ABC transporter permease subunit GldF n=1 Tax=Marinigracilibium pacificum TaxID=2729599 RepID=A0A848J6K6_9BACT|nr:gliding motility-associated ABC transporter permease subunit GldF [Marinigracilibium pacificum]NMM50094.1 gliding motility-associated ABC transporter permease subunit GldF [Marinigracilibium pacificum]